MASRIMVEGPLIKEKSSFIFSARRSYVDLFLKAANEDNLVHFYDVNAKVNWKTNNKNRFFAAFYTGRDVFNFDDNFGFAWGNKTATFRWNHLFNERLFSNTSIIASNFDYKLSRDTSLASAGCYPEPGNYTPCTLSTTLTSERLTLHARWT